jgi:hypothetical protein
MTRIIAKLFAVTLALTAFLPVAPLFAAQVTWLSGTGIDGPGCTATNPCATFAGALNPLNIGGQINCLNSPGPGEIGLSALTISMTIDCAGLFEVSTSAAFQLTGTNQTVRVRNLTISGSLGGISAIKVNGSGTLIIENCVFQNMAGIALDIEPNGPLNIVIKNSRMSNNAGGVLIKPAAGGSVTATFDGVTIVNNTGGLKTDSTNGAVKVDVANSTISNHTANGINIIGGAGASTMNILNLSHDVIASNGQAGIVANGTFAAALVDTTLLDNNGTGATSAVNSGRVITYGTNRVLGIAGSGFTSSVPLQ